MLVLDSEVLDEFCTTLNVLGPTHSKTILRFVSDVLKNTIAYEHKLKNEEFDKEDLDSEVERIFSGSDRGTVSDDDSSL